MLEGFVCYLFGEVEMCWVDVYFLFINFLYEFEIYFNGEWLEVLGCGVMEIKILNEVFLVNECVWVFGLGFECFVMVLFDIFDI